MKPYFYDETVRRPGIRFWVIAAVFVVLGSGGVWVANQYLFPAEASTLQLDQLESQLPVASPTANSATPSTSTGGTTHAPVQNVVTTTDSVTGVSVAHPADWLVRTADGLLLVRSEACGSTSALFYPVELLDRTVDAKTLLADTSTSVLAQLQSAGGTLVLGTVDASDEVSATSLLTGTLCGVVVEGVAQATVQGQRGLVKLHWFPSAQKQALANTMTKILASYKLTTGAEVLPYQGSGLQLPVPSGWQFTESTDSATVTHETASVTVVLLAFPATESLDTALDSWLQLQRDATPPLAKESVLQVDEQSASDSDGRQWNTKTRHLSYVKDGVAYRATVTAAYTDALGNNSLLTWQTAPESSWADDVATLASVAIGARVGGSHSLAVSGVLDPPTQSTLADTSLLTGTDITRTLLQSQSERWLPQLMRFELVQSSTAEQFLAPVTAKSVQTGGYSATSNGQVTQLVPVAKEGTDEN